MLVLLGQLAFAVQVLVPMLMLVLLPVLMLMLLLLPVLILVVAAVVATSVATVIVAAIPPKSSRLVLVLVLGSLRKTRAKAGQSVTDPTQPTWPNAPPPREVLLVQLQLIVLLCRPQNGGVPSSG
jgi:hypothetical protein